MVVDMASFVASSPTSLVLLDANDDDIVVLYVGEDVSEYLVENEAGIWNDVQLQASKKNTAELATDLMMLYRYSG